MKGRLTAAVVAAAALATLVLVHPAATGGSVSAQLDALPTTPAAAAPGYARSQFGSWDDEDGDGCDTRAEVLGRDLNDIVIDPHVCRVLIGTLRDPYTGLEWRVTAAQVDVDHQVALQDAWLSGAAQWTPARRKVFANDQGNLVATTAAVNRGKGGRGPDQWQPSGGPAAQCAYARQYVATKARWGLSVTVAQRAALARMLGAVAGGC